MLSQEVSFGVATLEDAEQIHALCKKYKHRIGRWWDNKAAIKEACERKHNRVIILAKENGIVKAFIILGLRAKKGKMKGWCHSLVTISEIPGIATRLQSFLPNKTFGLVSVRNITQNKVMEKSGYVLDKVITSNQRRKMNLWKKETLTKYSESVQQSLNEKLKSMDRS